jgi:2-polyprenyl-3-methyl-5-hydroxy-6-metoxy-1,4-benzoquinol methylase
MPLLPISAILKPPSLAQRRPQLEWMDQPGLDPHLHRQALAALARLNQAAGAVGALWPAVREAAKTAGDRPVRVLDVACGGGDVTLGLWQRARQAGLAIDIVGCDISATAVQYAEGQARQQQAPVTFLEHDAVYDPLPGYYDVAVCSLFLHHLEAGEVITLLSQLGSGCRFVVADDLVRTGWSYVLAWGATRTLTRNPVVRGDGPRSVEQAFLPAELASLAEQAGLTGARVRRRAPARMQLFWSHA